MTMHNSKNSLLDKDNCHNYGTETFKDFEKNFGSFMPKFRSNCYNYQSDKTNNYPSSGKLLGLTTAASNGGSGIRGLVVSCLHKPTGQTVVIKRYQLDEEQKDSNSCHNSQEHFNENVTFIMVSNIRHKNNKNEPWYNSILEPQSYKFNIT